MPRVLLSLLLLLAAACRTPAPAAAAPGAKQAPAQQQQPADPQPTADQACAVTLCREPRTVTLVLDEEREMRQELPPFPYVYQEVVYVVPGDDFRITGEVKGDRLVGLRVVREGEQVQAGGSVLALWLGLHHAAAVHPGCSGGNPLPSPPPSPRGRGRRQP